MDLDGQADVGAGGSADAAVVQGAVGRVAGAVGEARTDVGVRAGDNRPREAGVLHSCPPGRSSVAR